MGIFHDATRQAIREMIEEFGEASRFGHILNDQDLEAAAGRIASFFEMTLELRAGLAGGASSGVGANSAMGGGKGGTAPSPSAGAQRKPQTTQRPGSPRGAPLGPGFLQAGDLDTPRGPAFARTRAAAEVAADGDWNRMAGSGLRADDSPRLPVNHDIRLPRKRVGASERELEAFTQRGLRKER